MLMQVSLTGKSRCWSTPPCFSFDLTVLLVTICGTASAFPHGYPEGDLIFRESVGKENDIINARSYKAGDKIKVHLHR